MCMVKDSFQKDKYPSGLKYSRSTTISESELWFLLVINTFEILKIMWYSNHICNCTKVQIMARKAKFEYYLFWGLTLSISQLLAGCGLSQLIYLLRNCIFSTESSQSKNRLTITRIIGDLAQYQHYSISVNWISPGRPVRIIASQSWAKIRARVDDSLKFGFCNPKAR